MANIGGRSVPEAIMLGADGEAIGTVAAVSAVVASGESLSAAVDLGGVRLVAIQMPAAWTAADLSFQGSWDGTTYADLYDAADAEVVVQAAASRFIAVDPLKFLGIRYIKVRSGLTGAAVNQGAARTLKLIASS